MHYIRLPRDGQTGPKRHGIRVFFSREVSAAIANRDSVASIFGSASLDVCFVGSEPNVRAARVDQKRICLKYQGVKLR